jgi:hypothetical protein
VIVAGAPATGKTTLAHALGGSLGLAVITKDDINEALATPFPTGDRDWSRQLGVAAYATSPTSHSALSHVSRRPPSSSAARQMLCAGGASKIVPRRADTACTSTARCSTNGAKTTRSS